MPSKEQPIAHRLHTDPALRELVKLVGYRGIPYPIGKDDHDRLLAKYGKDRLVRAADELFDYDRDRKLTRLKEVVRKHCLAILGPAPEEWDSFYAGIRNPPPNPYRGEREQPDGTPERVAGGGQGTAASGAEPEPAEPARETDTSQTELDVIRQTHGRQLRQLLFAQHTIYQNYRPGDPIHEEATRRIELLEAEMRRRGNKVPPRPVWREPYNPPADDQVPAGREERAQNLPDDELSRRIATAKEVLTSESEHTGVYRQTKIELDLMAAEATRRDIHPAVPTPRPAAQTFDAAGFRDFSKATTHRLRELLDMTEYELGRWDPGTVTHEDAVRDYDMIQAELKRRETEPERSDDPDDAATSLC
jgi:hypothetical protein